ncbi:hypothetical protein JJB07_06705 [Tumebacillus sp. ITR2]|uniref:Phr family secreted Rap phosphatase inhibitor n=1 Tax=Tumebacillus amylolyticus TaxID=2801339 RepID=A0ABS1J7T5_9BACL|nr:hypothetical protein [Tumebacillus amylolyticus]MBL0386333.1 hypothetical protein [Tumebacillus amylolyticus]
MKKILGIALVAAVVCGVGMWAKNTNYVAYDIGPDPTFAHKMVSIIGTGSDTITKNV